MRVGLKFYHWIAGSRLSVAILLIAVSVSAQNLYVADKGSGNIYEFTPGGARSTFASGFSFPFGLAFDSSGNLFVTSLNGGSITEFTPGGARSTFASGLNEPCGLAFNSAGDLFATTFSNSINVFTSSCTGRRNPK